MKVLMVIEISKPLLVDAHTGKSYKLLMLGAGHDGTSFQRKVSDLKFSGHGETQAFQPQPILVGVPSLGLWPSRTGVPLISHVVVALGLSSALEHLAMVARTW